MHVIDRSISALNYANRLVGLTTVVNSILSDEDNKENKEGFKNVISHGINIILFITILSTVGMILLANPVVKVAFQRG